MDGDSTTTCMLDITTGHADWNHRNLKCQSNVLHQLTFESNLGIGDLLQYEINILYGLI